jgi:hypothetical protein
MNLRLSFAVLTLGVAAAAAFAGDDKKPAASPGENTVKGDYLEVRTCDVWVGACFANAEVGETGREATVAWSFKSGQWSGVDLSGRAAVLIVEAKHTLGDKYRSPLQVRDILLMDDKANDTQLEAMRAFVKAQLGDLFEDILSTDQIRSYKPHPRAYQLAIDRLKLRRDEILFVPSAGWDVAGAKWFGYPTYWVNRLNAVPEELGVDADAAGPDLHSLVRFMIGPAAETSG